jgi:hypothetical protein
VVKVQAKLEPSSSLPNQHRVRMGIMGNCILSELEDAPRVHKGVFFCCVSKVRLIGGKNILHATVASGAGASPPDLSVVVASAKSAVSEIFSNLLLT